MLDNLLSKVIAAGLAAGVFLLWWPAHLPSAGVQWLVLRGLAWTLAFEVLVLSFVPFERMATRALVRRRESRAARVRRRLAAAPAPARASGAVMLAFTGLLVPGLLLLHSGRLPAAAEPVAHTTKVVRKVVVRKVVHERTVVVREAAPAVAPGHAAAAAPATAAPKASAAAPVKKAAPKPSTSSPKTAAKKTTSTPAATTKPTPAAPVLPDPASAAAPADPPTSAAQADETAASG
jgi:hypothetical protein